MQEIQRAFQLISVLTQYPDIDWLLVEELRDELRNLQDEEVSARLARFLDYLETMTLDDLAENYVRTFDFNAKTALYLSYSDMGEERERGQTLVELKKLYFESGYLLNSDELPDYLPLFLEFVSVAPQDVSVQLIEKYRHSLQRMKQELENVNSPYADVLEACLIAADHLSIAH